jgi:hypothetical protein
MLQSEINIPERSPKAAAEVGPNNPAAKNHGIAANNGMERIKFSEENLKLGNTKTEIGMLRIRKIRMRLRRESRG